MPHKDKDKHNSGSSPPMDPLLDNNEQLDSEAGAWEVAVPRLSKEECLRYGIDLEQYQDQKVPSSSSKSNLSSRRSTRSRSKSGADEINNVSYVDRPGETSEDEDDEGDSHVTPSTSSRQTRKKTSSSIKCDSSVAKVLWLDDILSSESDDSSTDVEFELDEGSNVDKSTSSQSTLVDNCPDGPIKFSLKEKNGSILKEISLSQSDYLHCPTNELIIESAPPLTTKKGTDETDMASKNPKKIVSSSKKKSKAVKNSTSNDLLKPSSSSSSSSTINDLDIKIYIVNPGGVGNNNNSNIKDKQKEKEKKGTSSNTKNSKKNSVADRITNITVRPIENRGTPRDNGRDSITPPRSNPRSKRKKGYRGYDPMDELFKNKRPKVAAVRPMLHNDDEEEYEPQPPKEPATSKKASNKKGASKSKSAPQRLKPATMGRSRPIKNLSPDDDFFAGVQLNDDESEEEEKENNKCILSKMLENLAFGLDPFHNLYGTVFENNQPVTDIVDEVLNEMMEPGPSDDLMIFEPISTTSQPPLLTTNQVQNDLSSTTSNNPSTAPVFDDDLVASLSEVDPAILNLALPLDTQFLDCEDVSQTLSSISQFVPDQLETNNNKIVAVTAAL